MRPIQEGAWVDQNYDALEYAYRCVQRCNDGSGRHIFDKCTFAQWCRLAYRHSTLYTRDEQWMYDSSDSES